MERSEIRRLQICNRLSMKHTCCTFSEDEYDLDEDNGVQLYLSPELVNMNNSEQAQFREDDAYTQSHLDASMTLYHELNAEY